MINHEVSSLKSRISDLLAQAELIQSAHSSLRACYASGSGRVVIVSDHTLRFKAMHLYEELVVRYKAAKSGPDRARVPALWLNDLLVSNYDLRWVNAQDFVVAFVSENDSKLLEQLGHVRPQQLLVVSELADTPGLSIQLDFGSNATRSALFSLVLHLLCEAFEGDCPEKPVHMAVEDLNAALAQLETKQFIDDFELLRNTLHDKIAAGASIYLFGNGGSACDALEFCQALRSIKREDGVLLPAFHFLDPSLITCAYNDGYSPFVRAVEAQVKARDVVVAYSTSGNSKNIIDAVKLANSQGATSIAMTGLGGDLAGVAKMALKAPARSTNRIQELHGFLAEVLLVE